MTNLLTTLATAAIILSKSEQADLCAFAQSDQCDDKIRQEARRRLVQSNIRLAHKVAKKNLRTGLDFQDLLACATEGILIAIDKFDATQGASFTTYARMWMTAKCQEHVQANAGMLHCGSRTSKKLWSGLQKARKVLGDDATPEQIAEHMGLKAKDVRECLASMSTRGTSLDAPLSADGGTVATIIPGTGLRQDVRMERTQNTEAIASALDAFVATLKPSHADIFRGRVINDLLGQEARCAKSFGVTKQRVGQIEKQLRVKLADHFTRTLGADGVKAMLRASF
tara:strand:- start:513 stop:1361 length:849 start_codon:yes stop_codon:yes gene_type:complete